MSNIKKSLSAVALTTVVLASTVSPAFAEVTSYITVKNGVKYEYSVKDLRESIQAGLAGGDNSLYTRYKSESLISVKDSINGYIDADDVRQAIVNSIILQGVNLDVDAYTESGNAANIELGKVVKLDKDGNVIEDETPQELKVVEISAINNTSVVVNFNEVIEGEVVAADFTFDNGLTVVNAEKQAGDKRVILTTSAQVEDVVYALSYKGVNTGKTTKGLAPAVVKEFEITGAEARSNTSVVVFLKNDPLVNLTKADFVIPGLTIESLVRTNNIVTLKTSSQTAGAAYTVTGLNGGTGQGAFTGAKAEDKNMVLENVETVNLRQMKIDFKEPVKWTTANKLENYYLGMTEEEAGNVQNNSLGTKTNWEIVPVVSDDVYDEDGSVVDGATVTSVYLQSIDGELLTDLDLALNETATLEVRNITRNFVNTSQKHFTLRDKVKPQVAHVSPTVYIGNTSPGAISVDNGILTIKFDEPVKNTTQNPGFEMRLNGEKVDITTAGAIFFDVESSSTVNAHRTMTLDINTLISTPGTHKITLTGAKDLNNNIQTPNPVTYEFEIKDFVAGDTEKEEKAVIKEIRQIADNAIELEFDRKVSGATSLKSIIGEGTITIVGAAAKETSSVITWEDLEIYVDGNTLSYAGSNKNSRIVVFNAIDETSIFTLNGSSFYYNKQDTVKYPVVVKTDNLKDAVYRTSVWFSKDKEAPVFNRAKSTFVNDTEKSLVFAFDDGPFARPNGQIALGTTGSAIQVNITRTAKNNQTYTGTGTVELVNLDAKGNVTTTGSAIYMNAIKVVVTDTLGTDNLLTEGKFVNGESYTVTFPKGSIIDQVADVDGFINVEGPNAIEETEATITIAIEDAVEGEGRVPQTTKGLIKTNKDTVTNIQGFDSLNAVKKNQIAVFFDGEVLADTAKKLSNYTLDGKVLPQGTKIEYFEETLSTGIAPSITATIGGTGKNKAKTGYVVITLQEGTIEESGLYDFTVEGVTNKTGKFMLPVEASVNLVDNTAPELQSVTVQGSKEIIVEFSEAITVDEAKAKDNFEVIVEGTDVNQKIAVAKVEEIAGTNKLKLTLVQDIENASTAKVTVTLMKTKDGDKAMYILDKSDLKNEAKGKTVKN